MSLLILPLPRAYDCRAKLVEYKYKHICIPPNAKCRMREKGIESESECQIHAYQNRRKEYVKPENE